MEAFISHVGVHVEGIQRGGGGGGGVGGGGGGGGVGGGVGAYRTTADTKPKVAGWPGGTIV